MEVKVDNCDNCYNRHITTVAINWCSNCDEGLCSNCTEHHQVSKILKSHSLIPISDYQKLPHYIRDIKNCCQNHEEPFQLYCQIHEQCCCLSCVAETHSECKGIKPLIDVVKDVKSSSALEEIETSLKTIIWGYDNIRENRLENKSRLLEQKEKIIVEVYSIRKSINDHLDDLVNSIEKTISAEFEAADSKIDTILTEVEDRQTNIGQLIEEEETIKQLSKDLQTFLGLPFFQDRIKEETEYIANLQRDHKVDEVDLIFKLSAVDDFPEKGESLGTLTVSQNPSQIDFDVGKKERAQIFLPKEVCANNVSNIHRINYLMSDSETSVTGCTISPSGQLFFVDLKSKKLFMKSGSSLQAGDYKEIIGVSSMWDVTLVDGNKAAVTIPSEKKLC